MSDLSSKEQFSEDWHRGFGAATGCYKDRADAWHAVVDALLKGNRDLFANEKTGRQAAIDEIERLQRQVAEREQWAAAWHQALETVATVLEVNPCGSPSMLVRDISDAINKLRASNEPETARTPVNVSPGDIDQLASYYEHGADVDKEISGELAQRDAYLIGEALRALQRERNAQPPTVGEPGQVRDPDAAASELLQSYFWLKTLKPNTRYVRLQDDHDGEFRGHLSVTIGEDGDAWVALDEANARFRMPGFGGGASQYTRTALVILAEAIRRDNAEHPRRSSPTKPACDCEGPQKIGPGYHAPYCATMAGTEFARKHALSDETSVVSCPHGIDHTVTTDERGVWLCRKCGTILRDSPSESNG